MRKLHYLIALFLLFVMSCDRTEEAPTYFDRVTGTIIGVFRCGNHGSLLIQVDKEYPIGRKIEHTSTEMFNSVRLPHYGTFQNMIHVQRLLNPLVLEWYEFNPAMGVKISFSYRTTSEPDDYTYFFGGGSEVGWLVPMFSYTKYSMAHNYRFSNFRL